MDEILKAFDLTDESNQISPLGSGLVHQTYLVKNSKAYVLQKINIGIFKEPLLIAKNIKECAQHLNKNHPDYLFIDYISTKSQEAYARINKEYWRLSPFIKDSYTIDLVESPEMAFEAAKAVGAFSKNLAGLNPNLLGETIPNFHDLSFRYQQFQDALENGDQKRIALGKDLINKCLTQAHLLETFEKLKLNSEIPIRVQHHDTKINNILFDRKTERSMGMCDLDTIMPGYAISDLGDMIRTYTSAENEESTNWESIKIRPSYYVALIKGYLFEMNTVLSEAEKDHLFYAGEFLIYMQALRFLSDFLMADIYYPVQHEMHNFNRAKNQFVLLEDLQRKRAELQMKIDHLRNV